MSVFPPVRQNDFSIGELSADHAAAGDKTAIKRSLKQATNIRICNGYGFAERFGSQYLQTLSFGSVATVVNDNGQYIALIRAGGVDFLNTNGGIVQSVELAPWDVVQARQVTWHVRLNELYVAHQDFPTQVLRYAGGTWTLWGFAFAHGVGNSISQPYYRFAAKNITLRPSARTGSITLTASQPVFNNQHVGARFRWVGREILITAVTDTTTATGTVMDELPPSYQITVDDVTGFRIGQTVEGADSGAQGVICQIVTATDRLNIVMTDRWEGFLDDVADEVEYIIGPEHKSKIVLSSQTELTPPIATTVWDEQVVSPYRGYPGDVFEHAGRLGFANFPQLADAIVLSAPGTTDDFEMGDGSAEFGIFLRIGQSLGQRIRYCVGAASLIILTDRRVYYVPDSPDTPLSAATFQFVEIAPVGTSLAYPCVTEEGVVFIEAGEHRVMGILSTGTASSPWKLQDLSRHCSHLIDRPFAVGMTNGSALTPERYIFVLNLDGSMAVCFYDEDAPSLGWVKWETIGRYRSMTTIDGIVYALNQRQINIEPPTTFWYLEQLDASSQLDVSTLRILDADEPLVVIPLAGETVWVMKGTAVVGEYVVGLDGSIDIGPHDAGVYQVGYHFDLEVVLWPPEAEGDTKRPMFLPRRIGRVAVRTQDTGVFTLGLETSANENMRPAYDQGDNFDDAPPLRSEIWRTTLAGWVPEPCVRIRRPLPHPVHILSVAMEVAR